MSAIAQEFVDIPAAAAACAHCGANLQPSCSGRFCCVGCAAAFHLIQELGLRQFYDRRVLDPAALPLRPAETAAADYTAFVSRDGERCTLHLLVDGLTCAACVWLIESVLARETALEDGRVNLTSRRLTLRWRGPASDAARYVGLVTKLGFRVVPFDMRHAVDPTSAVERDVLRALAVAGFAAGNIMLLSVSVWAGHSQGMGAATRDLMHWFSALIALPAIVYSGRPFFRSALGALSAGRTNMDVPISIGVVLAAAMSLFETMTSGAHAYFDSAVTLLFFLLVGRYLDLRARGRARAAATHLLSLGANPLTILREDGKTVLKFPSDVVAGETVLVAAGERIAVDGDVVDGRSDLDTSLVTGESVPLSVEPHSGVFAGMVNLTAPLRIVARASGERTLLAEIVRLMEAAEHGRTRFVALADRVARLYAPVVHILAAVTFLGWFAFSGVGWQPALLNAVAVLIITCPCALALAVPVVQVVASARLSRGGVLLKSATALERLAKVDTVIFDKTGTLTLGELELRRDAGISAEDLSLAASIAGASRHPLARALMRADPAAVPAEGVTEHPGRGLEITRNGQTIRLGSRVFCAVDAAGLNDTAGPELWLARAGQKAVRFIFADRLRPDAAATIARLKRAGIRAELLSGDRAPVVAAVARDVGIEAWHAGVSPAGKCAHLTSLQKAGCHVLMVGDGLNDAPALAAASVSLSPSTAADISQTVADAVFQGSHLAPVVEIVETARRSQRLIVQNLGLAIVYNLAAVPLAMAGYVTPLIAAIAMSSSSVLVILNALRLARGGKAR